MSNLISTLAMNEEDAVRTVFINYRKEAGFSFSYDPHNQSMLYQVFIHSRFPHQELERWDFDTFAQARSFAAQKFKEGWKMLSWDFKTKRPCEEGGKECGQGDCDTCRDLAKDQVDDPNAVKGCGACGMAL